MRNSEFNKKTSIMKKLNTLYTRDTFSTLCFYLAILIFIIGFNFTDSHPPSGWYQQFIPNIGGKQIADITFLDSLTGIAVANQYPTDSNYVLKTTNSGDNWQIIYRQYFPMQHIQFLNLNTGYACAGYLYKTMDGGYSWTQVNTSGISAGNMYVLNQDTIWLIDSDALVGGVFLTTNGGVNWTQQLWLGVDNPDHIYMFNARIGFISKTNSYTRKTTDGGQSWFVLTNGSGEGFYDMYFADSLLGWGAFYNMRKTTNGGINWINQVLPSGGIILTNGIYEISKTSIDTIWGVGGQAFYGSGQFRGIVYRTINGGTNWLFQVPDTTIHIGKYYYTNFISNKMGWAYSLAPMGIHTVIGGDTVWYIGIVQKSKEVPRDFELKQNYPNPFNPRTVIPYSLKSAGYVRIIAYDILGREVQRLVDQKQNAGEYEVDFMGKFSSSGVYFYRMTVEPSTGSGQAFEETKKMILLK
jgi:photosystem II stability/assembly factor-like uncharacterized protein